MKIDPICSMEVNEKVAKKKKLVVTVHGDEFFFCCKNCKQEFLENPPVYPDHCANCMKKSDFSKTLWKIRHKDVLYCFCSKECKKDFEEKKFGEMIY